MKFCCECKNFECLINQGVTWCSKNNPVFFLDGEEVVCEDREPTGSYTTTTYTNGETFAIDYADTKTDTDLKFSDVKYYKPEDEKSLGKYRCPHCGESYYRVDSTTSTAVYCPRVYKDGKLISHDSNTITEHCSCLACGQHFDVKNGKQEEVKND